MGVGGGVLCRGRSFSCLQNMPEFNLLLGWSFEFGIFTCLFRERVALITFAATYYGLGASVLPIVY